MRYKKASILLLTCLTLSFTGCKNPNDFGGFGNGDVNNSTDSAISHEHTYDDVWQYDELNHWQTATCEHTDEKGYLEGHRYESVEIDDDGYISYDCKVCDYASKEKTELFITCLEGTDSCYSIDGDTITFTGITADSVYAISGKYSGNIVIDVDESLKFELEMQGFSLYSSTTNPITALNGDKFTLAAKKDTVNYIYDLREAIDDTDETLYKGAVYSHVDLDVEGKGSLSVLSEHNNGIQTKDDLELKNLTLTVNCQDNALKGNDSVTLTGGNITLIAKSGDGIKTENSDISEKGNQRGTITITESVIEINAACDGIDAAYDVVIDNETTNITINTDKYSEEVTDVSEDVYYIRFNSQNYKYSVKYYNSDDDYVWENATYYKSVSNGPGGYYYYYSFPVRKEYQKIKIFVYTSSQEQGQETAYQMCTDYLTWNTSYDTIAISSRGYSWTNYTTTSGNFGGGMGGMQDGNTEKGDYSTKGIKAANEIVINAGAIYVQAYDDAIHAGDGDLIDTKTALENGNIPTGNLTINGGTIMVYSHDDGIHAEGTLLITNGNVSVTKSYEGLEGTFIIVQGGKVSVISSDDGFNGTSKSGAAIEISGGNVYVYAGGDGIDSNSTTSKGAILFSGGKVVVICNSNGNAAIDSDGGYTHSGGSVIAIMSTGGMTSETTNGSSTGMTTKSSISLSNDGYLTITVDSTMVAVVQMPCSMTGFVVYLGSSRATIASASSSSVIRFKWSLLELNCFR